MASLVFAQNVLKYAYGSPWWAVLRLENNETILNASVSKYTTLGTVGIGSLRSYSSPTYDAEYQLSATEKLFAFVGYFELQEERPSPGINAEVQFTIEKNDGQGTYISTLTYPVKLYTSVLPSDAVGVFNEEPDQPRFVLFDTNSTIAVPTSRLNMSVLGVVSANRGVQASISGQQLVLNHSQLTLTAGQPCGFFNVVLNTSTGQQTARFVLFTNFPKINSVAPTRVKYTDKTAIFTIAIQPSLDVNIPTTKQYKVVCQFNTTHAITDNSSFNFSTSSNQNIVLTPSWPEDYFNFPTELVFRITGSNFPVEGAANQVSCTVFVDDHGLTPQVVQSTIETHAQKNAVRPSQSPLSIDLQQAFNYNASDPVIYEVVSATSSIQQLATALLNISDKKGEYWWQENTTLKIAFPSNLHTSNADITLSVRGRNIFGRYTDTLTIKLSYFPKYIDAYSVSYTQSGANINFAFQSGYTYTVSVNPTSDFAVSVNSNSSGATITATKVSDFVVGNYLVVANISDGQSATFAVDLNFPLLAPEFTQLPTLQVSENQPAELNLASYALSDRQLGLIVKNIYFPVVLNCTNNAQTILRVALSSSAGELDGAILNVVVETGRRLTNTLGQVIESSSTFVTVQVNAVNKPPKFAVSNLFRTITAGTVSTVEVDSLIDKSQEPASATANVICTIPFSRTYYSTIQNTWNLIFTPSISDLGTHFGVLRVVDSAGAWAELPVTVVVQEPGNVSFNLPTVIPAVVGQPVTIYLGNYLVGISESYVTSFEKLSGPGEVKKV